MRGGLSEIYIYIYIYMGSFRVHQSLFCVFCFSNKGILAR
jgi:hypothetical protein